MQHKKMILLSVVLMGVGFFSCSTQTTIGLKEHKYTHVPKHVVWLQIPSFFFQHLALLLYKSPSEQSYNAWGELLCTGMSWNYNLYKLRPSEMEQSITQITGDIDVQNSCKDFKKEPVWSKLQSIGYKTFIIENQAKKRQSLLQSIKCVKDKKLDYNSFLKDTRFLLMHKKFNFLTKYSMFHYEQSYVESQKQSKIKDVIFIDKSCQRNNCVADLRDNIEAFWEKKISKNKKTFLLIRDFEYQNYIEQKNIFKLREKLYSYTKLIQRISDLNKLQNKNILFVISSIGSKRMIFPKQGVVWNKVFQSGRHIKFKNDTFFNTVLALGPRSENFCGNYHDRSLIYRFTWLKKGINYLKQMKKLILLPKK